MSNTAELVHCNVDDLTQRFSFTVQLKDKRLGVSRSASVVLDTGSMIVLLAARTLGLGAVWEDYVSRNSQVQTYVGVVSDVPTQAYRYLVDEFRVGRNLVLRNFPISISFDSRVKTNLLGMPFIKLFTTHIVASKQAIVLQATSETKDIVTGKVSARDVDIKALSSLYAGSFESFEDADAVLDSPSGGLKSLQLM